jgi:hypothetical protein
MLALYNNMLVIVLKRMAKEKVKINMGSDKYKNTTSSDEDGSIVDAADI